MTAKDTNNMSIVFQNYDEFGNGVVLELCTVELLKWGKWFSRTKLEAEPAWDLKCTQRV